MAAKPYVGWLPDPLDHGLSNVSKSNRPAESNKQLGSMNMSSLPGTGDLDNEARSKLFLSVLCAIDDVLRVRPTSSTESTSSRPSTSYQDPQSAHIYADSRVDVDLRTRRDHIKEPIEGLLVNLESALKASESMLCRTQDLDYQAHQAWAQVKLLEEKLAQKELQHSHEVNELQLLLRVERSERDVSAELFKREREKLVQEHQCHVAMLEAEISRLEKCCTSDRDSESVKPKDDDALAKENFHLKKDLEELQRRYAAIDEELQVEREQRKDLVGRCATLVRERRRNAASATPDGGGSSRS